MDTSLPEQLGHKQAKIQDRVSSDNEPSRQHERVPLKRRILRVLWDTADKSPEERKLVNKLDWWILSYCCVAYFVKYLDQTNVSKLLSRVHFELA
jgi:ACS family pantothenate transporter-like MFS transporter